MNISKKHLGIVLCVVGVLFISIGIYQVTGSPYHFEQNMYKSSMKMYEGCKLSMEVSMFYDIRQHYSDLASDMYNRALDAKQNIAGYIIKCVVLCLLGVISSAYGIKVIKKN